MKKVKVVDIFGNDVYIEVGEGKSIRIVPKKSKAIVPLTSIANSEIYKKFREMVFVSFRNGFRRKVLNDIKEASQLLECLCLLNRVKPHKILIFHSGELEYIRKIHPLGLK